MGSCHVNIGIAVYLQNMGMIFTLVMMVALLNNQNYPSAHAIALTQRNDLNQLIQDLQREMTRMRWYPKPVTFDNFFDASPDPDGKWQTKAFRIQNIVH